MQWEKRGCVRRRLLRSLEIGWEMMILWQWRRIEVPGIIRPSWADTSARERQRKTRKNPNAPLATSFHPVSSHILHQNNNNIRCKFTQRWIFIPVIGEEQSEYRFWNNVNQTLASLWCDLQQNILLGDESSLFAPCKVYSQSLPSLQHDLLWEVCCARIKSC